MRKTLGGCAAISIDPRITVAAIFDIVAIVAKFTAVFTIPNAAVARVASSELRAIPNAAVARVASSELRDIVWRLSERRLVYTLLALVLLPPRHIGRH